MAAETVDKKEDSGSARTLTADERARMERLTSEMHEECSRLLEGRKPRFPKLRNRGK